MLLLYGTHGFLNHWYFKDAHGAFVTEANGALAEEYDGLTGGGFVMIALAVAGVLLLGFSLLARAARSALEGHAATKPQALRVWRATSARAERSVLEGIVRSTAITIQSPIGNEPCIAFGLRGNVAGAPIDDADGADFDIELATGERVMVSLEHAILDDSVHEEEVAPTDALQELFDDRGVGSDRTATSLGEVLLRDGEEITIEAEVSEGKSIAYRDSARARVAMGTEDGPLVVRRRSSLSVASP